MPLPLRYAAGTTGHLSVPSSIAKAMPPDKCVCMWQWKRKAPGFSTWYRSAIQVELPSAGVVRKPSLSVADISEVLKRGGTKGLTWRIGKVEGAGGHDSSGCSDGGEIEVSDSLAEDEGFVAVLVQWMGLGEGSHDLDDEIDPLAHIGSDHCVGGGDVLGLLEEER